MSGALIAASAAGSAAGGILGYMAQMDAMDRQKAMQDKALQEFLSINIPDPKAQEVALKRFVEEGTLTPQFEAAIKQQPSEFNHIVANQAQKSAQNRALGELENIGYSGGLRLQDKAAQQDAMLQGQVRDRGARQAILDNMNQRGQGGSGFALQAQLQGQQAAGDREANTGLRTAAAAQDRALQSIIGSGDLATKYRGQDFQEQSARAQANDAINHFNTQNMQGVQHSNVGIGNRAQEMNLAAKQGISNQNVGIANKEQQYNKSLLQQQFDNQMNLANSKSNAYLGMGQTEAQRGKTTANMWSNVGSAAGGGAAAYGSYLDKQPPAEEDGYGPQRQADTDKWAKLMGAP